MLLSGMVGTIAKTKGCQIRSYSGPQTELTTSSRRWFMALRPGHTPQNNPIAAFTERLIVEWKHWQERRLDHDASP